jgi:hypothetical protein
VIVGIGVIVAGMSGQDDRTAAAPHPRRGRPRVSAEETVAVNTRLPVTDYDKLLEEFPKRDT